MNVLTQACRSYALAAPRSQGNFAAIALLHTTPRLLAIKDPKAKKTIVRYDANEVFIAHARCTFNNTFLTVTNDAGDAIKSMSCGQVGYVKGKRKQPFAAQTLATEVAKAVQLVGINTVRLRFKGVGPGRQTILKGLMAGGLNVVAIEDITSPPHNGCRKKKSRRL